jgi:hypothetical protein
MLSSMNAKPVPASTANNQAATYQPVKPLTAMPQPQQQIKPLAAQSTPASNNI